MNISVFLRICALAAVALSSLEAADTTIQPDELLGKEGDDPEVSRILKMEGTRLHSETTVRTPIYKRDGAKVGDQHSKLLKYEALEGRLTIVISSTTKTIRGKEKAYTQPRVSFVSWEASEDQSAQVELPYGLQLGQTSDDAMAALQIAFGRISGDFRTRNGAGYITLQEGVAGAPICVRFAEGRVHRIEFSQ